MQWSHTDRWKLAASYTLLQMQTRPRTDYVSRGDNPQNQFQLRSYLYLPHDLEFNSAVYYVDSLPHLAIPSYVRLDLGVVWRPARCGRTRSLGPKSVR